MKIVFPKIFLLLVVVCLASLNSFSQNSNQFSINQSPLPKPTSPVTDNAGVLDAATKQSIEKRLIEFRDKTNPKVELAVVTVKTTGERPIYDYSLALSRGWGIGSKESDNPSALLLIAVDDRKYFTQISRDLEDELTDGVVGQLQRQYLVPAFRQGNYAKGINDTMEAYIRTIESKQAQEPVTPKGDNPKELGISTSTCALFICLAIIFIIFLISLSRANSGKGNKNDKDRWRGGGFGGGTSSSDSALPWIVVGGGSSWGSGGGSSDWGGSSGGGDSWGGFGGGGDFGGGGAGGDW